MTKSLFNIANVLFSLILPLIFFSTGAFAEILQKEEGSHSLNGVNVAKAAHLKFENLKSDLTPVGAGTRTKKVLGIPLKVYVAQLYVSDFAKFQKSDENSLASLEKINTVALQMTFLRTVEAQKVQVSFQEALKANSIDTEEVSVADFLKVVSEGGDAYNKKNLTLVFNKNPDGTEYLLYEDTNEKVYSIVGNKGLTEKIMSIWLGVPSDEGLVQLKKELLSK